MMRKERLLAIFVLTGITLIGGSVFAQVVPDSLEIRKFEVLRSTNIDGELVPHQVIREVYIFPAREFRTNRQRRLYGRLVYNVKRVYPYAKTAREKIEMMEARLATIRNEKQKKAFINQVEKELFSEFEDDIRKMTLTQGKILVKLIDRETGDTSYEILKEFKGSLVAFFWQSVARFFGSNLKMEYDPYGEDLLIEEIVVMIENGYL